MTTKMTASEIKERKTNDFQTYFAYFMLFIFIPLMAIFMAQPAKITIEKLTSSPETFNGDYVAIQGHVSQVLEGPTYIVSDENGKSISVVKKSNAKALTVSQDTIKFVGYWKLKSDGSYYLVIR